MGETAHRDQIEITEALLH